MHIHWKFLLPLFFILYVETSSASILFPGKTWIRKSPESLGMSSEMLQKASRFIGGNGCIIKNGYLAYSWGEYAKPADIASAAKPFYAHFLFKAIEDKKISSIDEKIVKYDNRLRSLNPELNYKDSFITWRHLANQISCYGVSEYPGTAYDYNDWQMALFIDTLFTEVYNKRSSEWDEHILHPLLTDILNCEDNPSFAAFGEKDRPGRISISPRDFARFGLLYLNRGIWNKKQVISKGFAEFAINDPLPNSIPRTAAKQSIMIPGQRTLGSRTIPDDQCDHSGSYSWLWWINGIDRNGERNWVDAPIDTYAALGHGGNEAMIVLPEYNIIISWNRSEINNNTMQNKAIKLVIDSITDKSLSNKGIIPDKLNKAFLSYRNGKSFFFCGPGDPEGFLYRGNLNTDGTRTGDQLQLINKLKQSGANCVYLIAVRSNGGDGDKTQNPFIGNDPNNGLNHSILDQWDKWFAEMDRNGILIFFIFYDDSVKIWDTGDEVGDKEKEFISSIVNRYKKYDDLIWCIAEEYQESLTSKRVSKLAKIIKLYDEYDHPIAVHLLSGLDFGVLADDSNIDQFAIQYNVLTERELHDGLVKAFRSANGRYNLNMSEAADFGSGAILRKKIWACAMSGANVMVLGMDIEKTPQDDMNDCGKLVKFMKTVDLQYMQPADEYKLYDTDYVLASAGGDYVLYSGDVSSSIGIKGIEQGTYELRWFDCVKGIWVIEPYVQLTRSSVRFRKPSILGNEVALYIRCDSKTINLKGVNND